MATTTPDAPAPSARLRLLAWLSPAFPVGSFSYSAGLEGAVHEGLVVRAGELRDWAVTLMEHGSLRNEAVLFCEAWRRGRGEGDLSEIADLAEALAGSPERHREAILQGEAFLAAVRNWPELAMPALSDTERRASSQGYADGPGGVAYCVAVGAAAGANGVPLEEACAAFLFAQASNMVQAAIRLSVLGQTEAVAVLAALEAPAVEAARRAAVSSTDDLGSATVMAEIVSLRHETQHSRLFRS